MYTCTFLLVYMYIVHIHVHMYNVHVHYTYTYVQCTCTVWLSTCTVYWCNIFTDLSWQVTLGEYEGGETLPLLSTLSNKPVTTSDVYDYVQHYAELRMIRIIEEPLMVSKMSTFNCRNYW